jgi:DNA repair protein RecO (recombination protein O)
MKTAGRILLAPAYLLHQAPWRDSSRILEFFTREHGRVTVFARGVRRPGSGVRSVLQPFQRLLVSFSMRGDAGTFIGAELDGVLEGALPAERIMSGFYLNELLLKLIIRHDSHPQLYEDYASALAGLRSARPEAFALRLFEKRLLESLGYGLELTREAGSGAAVEAQAHYHYLPERGAVLASAPSPKTYSGATLSALAAEALDDDLTLRETRRLLREALNNCLEGRALKSRDVMLAMKRMSHP